MWKYFILLLFITLSNNLFAQKESWNWIFTNNAGISFNTKDTIPKAIIGAKLADVWNTIPISDKNGNLLFYLSDYMPVHYPYVTKIIYNKLHQPMKNANYNDDVITHNNAIIPIPGVKDKYYFFYDYLDEFKNNKICYDIIDMTLENGLGAVTEKRKFIKIDENDKNPLLEGFLVFKHSNNLDYWLIYRYNNDYRSILISNFDIKDSVINNINKYDFLTKDNIIHPIDKNIFVMSSIAVNINTSNPDYRVLLISKNIEFYKFDSDKGKLNIYQSYNLNSMTYPDLGYEYEAQYVNYNDYYRTFTRSYFEGNYFAFSQDGTKFYHLEQSIDAVKYSVEISIFQYKVDGTNIDIKSKKKVGKPIVDYINKNFKFDGKLYLDNIPNPHSFKGIKLGPNGKIYIIRQDTTFLTVIENPNEDASKVIVTDVGVDLGKGKGIHNFPKFIPDYYNTYIIIDTNKIEVCQGDSILLKGMIEDTNANNVKYTWISPQKIRNNKQNAVFYNLQPNQSGYYKLEANINGALIYDSVLVTVNPLPNFKINGKTNLFKNEIIKLSSSLVDKKVKYYWSTGDTLEFININNPGTYYLTITNEKGCTSTDSIRIEADYPYLYSERDTICPGTELELKVKPDTLQASINWSTGDNGKSIIINKQGEYLAYIDYGDNSYDTLKKNIYEYIPTKINIDKSKILACIGDSIELKITNSKDFINYQWNTNEKNKGFWSKQSGKYFVTGLDKNGCESRDSLNITVDSLKKPTIRQDIPLCYGSIGKLSVLETYDTYLWSTGEKTQSIFVTKSGTYKVVCTLSGGCSDSSEITVTEVPKPKIEIISDKGNTICQKGEKITLSVNPNDPEYSYFWSTGLITPSITVSDSGTYYLFAVNKYGCADTAIYRINIAPEFTPEITANKFKICKGEELELSANPNQTDYKYLWSNGLTSSKITIKDPGTYKVKVSNQFGCTKEIEQKIGQNPSISIQLDTSRAQIGNSTEITMTIFCESKIQLNNIEIKLIIDGSSLLITEEQKYLTYNYLPNQNLELILKIDSIDFNKSSKMQYKVRGNTLLANNLNNPIIIDNVSLKADEFCIEKIPGALILEKICTYDLRKVKLIDEFSFEILPNPASDYIEISLSPAGGGRGWTLEIFNIFGENTTPSNHSGLPLLLVKEGIIKIDISNLPAGVYFIKIGDKFKKFIKL